MPSLTQVTQVLKDRFHIEVGGNVCEHIYKVTIKTQIYVGNAMFTSVIRQICDGTLCDALALAFVRENMRPPERNKSYNLMKPNLKDYAQIKLHEHLIGKYFKHMRNGRFLEVVNSV